MKERAAGDGQKADSETLAEASTIMTHDRRVLVVEDDPPVRSIVAMAVEAEGYEVETASNGQDALNKIQSHAPHVILLDLMLPVLDGRQLIKLLREDPTTAHIPIIVMSAAYDVANDPAVESVVVLPKPFDVGMLLLLLDDALREQETVSQG
jgi:CheY-like chemotaxis protein